MSWYSVWLYGIKEKDLAEVPYHNVNEIIAIAESLAGPRPDNIYIGIATLKRAIEVYRMSEEF